MRYLLFTEQDGELFQTLVEGMLATAERLSVPQMRVALKVDAKLEPLGIGDGPVRQFAAVLAPHTVALEDAEYALVKQMLDNVPWAAGARARVVRLFDFLEAAPTAQPVPLEPPTSE